ncbi:MAG: PVC-type heme-binding CxxCH protein, partial [Gemmataceae bacterium]
KETFTYKDGSKRSVATMRKGIKDVVKALYDTRGEGKYDMASVVLEDELPSSILLHDGWIYLTGRGTVRRYKQSKTNGPYDIKEVIAQGFCGYHHHQVSGLTLGNDGMLYITSGDDDNYVEGSDGSRATVLRTGAVFRCRPDGSKMEVFSRGYRNPYRDVAFDKYFNMFHVDNDNEDGSKFMGCRLMHVAEGADFGWRLREGARCCQPDFVRGAVYGELPGKLAPMLKTGRGAPAGLLVYNDTYFPEPMRGLLYYPDVYRKNIRAYQIAPRGTTFEVIEEFELLKSNDPLFRPCQAVLGPDGAIYVVDWRTDSGGAGQLSGDGKHGRIYRLSWAGTDDMKAIALRPMNSWEKVIRSSDEELLKLLASENLSDRQKAQGELVHRGDRNWIKLLYLFLAADQPVRARIAALGALHAFWNEDVEEGVVSVLRDQSPTVRRLAVEALALHAKPGERKIADVIVRYLEDPEPTVRRAMFLALGKINAPGTEDVLGNLFKTEDMKDLYLWDGLLRGIERLGKPGIEKLITLAESGEDKIHTRVVDAFLALRTRPAAEAIPRLLAYPHLDIQQRADLLHSYSNYQLDPPISTEPILDYLIKNPKEPARVKLAGLEAVNPRDLEKPEAAKKIEQIVLTLLDEPTSEARMGALAIVDQARIKGAAPRVAELLADPERVLAERIVAARALRALQSPKSLEVLKGLVDTKGLDATLRLETFRTLAAVDPGVAAQFAEKLLADNDADMQKEAVLVLGSKPEGAKLIAERFLQKKLPRTLLPQVADSLRVHAAKNPDMGKLLTEVMKGGLILSLDKEEVERIAQLVKTKGNAQRGKLLYLDSNKLACINCHRLEGVGGLVGPDLTRVWDTHTLDKIMESMIDPSKEIKEGFQGYVATTKKGQVYQGLKIAQSKEELHLRDANGRDIRIPAGELEEVVPAKVSVMPDNVISQLSFDQFIDLVAFLRDRGQQESLRGTAFDFYAVGPFGDDLEAIYPPEKNPDPTVTYDGPKKTKLAWQPVRAASNGHLDLRPIAKKDNASAYALTYVYSPKAQQAQLLVGSGNLDRIWINGVRVHEQITPRTAVPEQDKVDVDLKEGWNTVLAKVVKTTSNQSLYLRFAGDGLKVSAQPNAAEVPVPAKK